MDWYLAAGPDQTAAASDLRRELRGYLERHATRDSDLAGTEVAVSELIQNGVEHAEGPVWVTLRWSEARPTLSVYDLGAGFEVPDEVALVDVSRSQGRGLYIVDALVEDLRGERRAGGGAVVHATLPVERAPATSIDPPRRRANVLPALDEAEPSGGFGKEAFLRALVVQLAQAVDAQEGPEAAEAAVAQVGTDVGGQMEEEYRQATGVVGRLTPQQIGECYVRLKHAIDGRFTLVEANEQRIVLTNEACPFGEAVRRAPALCRMTSSVFGGIAARNSDGGALVQLEERIAVGDPRCRIVVWLEPEGRPAHLGHRYRPAVA